MRRILGETSRKRLTLGAVVLALVVLRPRLCRPEKPRARRRPSGRSCPTLARRGSAPARWWKCRPSPWTPRASSTRGNGELERDAALQPCREAGIPTAARRGQHHFARL